MKHARKAAEADSPTEPVDAQAAALARLESTVDRFERTVSRLVVAMERYLSENDHERDRAQKILEAKYPDFAQLQERVRSKHAKWRQEKK